MSKLLAAQLNVHCSVFLEIQESARFGGAHQIAEFPMTSKRTPELESLAITHAVTGPHDDDRPFPIVGIGASVGRLEAYLPPDTGMRFVLVQHLDPQYNSALTEILSRATSLPVRDITDKLRVEANHVYVITPNTILGITKGVLTVRPRPQKSVHTGRLTLFSRRWLRTSMRWPSAWCSLARRATAP